MMISVPKYDDAWSKYENCLYFCNLVSISKVCMGKHHLNIIWKKNKTSYFWSLHHFIRIYNITILADTDYFQIMVRNQ